jgi:hypothetical protein
MSAISKSLFKKLRDVKWLPISISSRRDTKSVLRMLRRIGEGLTASEDEVNMLRLRPFHEVSESEERTDEAYAKALTYTPESSKGILPPQFWSVLYQTFADNRKQIEPEY